MRQANPPLGRIVRVAIAVGALSALSGCGGGSYLGSLLGSDSTPAPTPAAATGAQVAGQAATGQAATGQAAAAGPRELVCPFVDVREGAAAHRVYAGQPSNANVRYQFSIGDVARECRVVGDRLVMRIGVEGRVLLGPAGGPSSFTVPVSIAVRDEQSKNFVASRVFWRAAVIPQGASNTVFSVVSDEIAVPFRGNAANQDYQIFVGFDGASAATGSARRR